MKRKHVNKTDADAVNNSETRVIHRENTGCSQDAPTLDDIAAHVGDPSDQGPLGSVSDTLVLGQRVRQASWEMYAVGYSFGLHGAPRSPSRTPDKLSLSTTQYLHECWHAGYTAGEKRRLSGVPVIGSMLPEVAE